MSNPNEQYITAVPDPYEEYRNNVQSMQENNTEYYNANYDIQDISRQLNSYRNQEFQEYEENKAKDEQKKEEASKPEESLEVEETSQEQTEEENQTQEEMLERQEASFVPVEYVVRGAYIRCTCGSHCRRLNLPGNHENYKAGRPLVNAKDSIPGDKTLCTDETQKHLINIPYFGVCVNGESPGETVLMVKDAERDPSGNVIKESEKMKWYTMGKTQNVKGHICMPAILTNWLNANEYVQVGDSYAITTRSFAVCQYGGIVEILQSGQSMDDNIDPDE